MGQRLGSLIGAVGGVLFVLLNAGGLGQPTGTVLRVAGVVAFVGVLWVAVVRTRGREQGPPPSPHALRVYRICVVAEVVAIPVGSLVITRVLHRPELTLVWVVFVVGVHFLPFARAFGLRRFGFLGAALVVVALVGGAVALAAASHASLAAAATGVAAGVLLLAFALAGAFPLHRDGVRGGPPAPGRPSAR